MVLGAFRAFAKGRWMVGRPKRAECLGAERRKGSRSLNRRCGSQPGRGGVGPWVARVGSPDEVQLGGRPARRGCSDQWLYTAWLQPKKCIPVVLKTRSTRGGVLARARSSKGSGQRPPEAFLLSGGFWFPGPVAASRRPLPLIPHSFLPVSLLWAFLLKPSTGLFGLPQVIPSDLILRSLMLSAKTLFFPKSSQSRVLGVRMLGVSFLAEGVHRSAHSLLQRLQRGDGRWLGENPGKKRQTLRGCLQALGGRITRLTFSTV